jgi:hypothetical protein
VGTRISVLLKGPLGLDDAARLLGELNAETGLAWRQEPVDEGSVLSGGLVEILLVAIASRTVEMAYGAAVERAERVVERWRAERLDAPQASVQTQTVPETETTSLDEDSPGAEASDG